MHNTLFAKIMGGVELDMVEPVERTGPRRLLIMACSGRKRGEPGLMPAIHRYDGPLWQTLRTVDPEASKARVAFLSAKLGFRDAREGIEDYDLVMTASLASQMIAGGTGLSWPRPARKRACGPSGIHAAAVMASIASYGKHPIEDVALVGGHLYIAVMQSYLREFIQTGLVLESAPVTIINGPIGVMRQRLRAWLNSDLAG